MSAGSSVVFDLVDLFDFAATDLPECKRIANQVAKDNGQNISWGER